MSSASMAEGEVGQFTEVVVVRHGETSWNASRIIQVTTLAFPPVYFSSLELGTIYVLHELDRTVVEKLEGTKDDPVVHLFLMFGLVFIMH